MSDHPGHPENIAAKRIAQLGELDESLQLELYSPNQIKQWLKKDKMDPKTAAKLKRLLNLN